MRVRVEGFHTYKQKGSAILRRSKRRDRVPQHLVQIQDALGRTGWYVQRRQQTRRLTKILTSYPDYDMIHLVKVKKGKTYANEKIEAPY